MSSKVQEKKAVGTELTHDERWQSGRARFGLQNLRFGRDKKWHFSGQQSDEEVQLVVRKHWWFLVKPALPLIGSFIVLSLILWGAARLPNPLFPWTLLEILAVVLILGTAGWFVWRDLMVWYLETYIITNKRIINSRGLLEPTRQTTPIENVKQVGVDFETGWGFMLRYGLVHIYLVGGDLIIKDIPYPLKVKDIIDEINNGIQAKKPKEEKPPTPSIPEVAAVIETLAKGKEPPKLEDADGKYKLRNPKGRLGPRRTFGIFRNTLAEVHYTSGEFSVKYIQRSHYVLFRKLALPVLALLLVLPLAVYIPASGNAAIQSVIPIWFFVMTLLMLGLLIFIFFMYIDYLDDIYIFTNKRIIDIHRRFMFFYELSVQIDYKNIKDIKVKVPNVLQRLLDIGDIIIEVPGNAPGITLSTVDHPFVIQDKIVEIQKSKEKADSVKKINDEKKELHMWFGKVVSTLVETTQLKGAPNLQKLELLEAMERANELGFHVIVSDEDPSNQEILPGLVVHQSPPPGTAINPGGEIQVVLSRRPTAAEMADMM
ncbi:MAG: hypothetical protein NVS4B7_08900 [Ktedonobacteraceae bacterium]